LAIAFVPELELRNGARELMQIRSRASTFFQDARLRRLGLLPAALARRLRRNLLPVLVGSDELLW
jgi:hypothetical protein